MLEFGFIVKTFHSDSLFLIFCNFFSCIWREKTKPIGSQNRPETGTTSGRWSRQRWRNGGRGCWQKGKETSFQKYCQWNCWKICLNKSIMNKFSIFYRFSFHRNILLESLPDSISQIFSNRKRKLALLRGTLFWCPVQKMTVDKKQEKKPVFKSIVNEIAERYVWINKSWIDSAFLSISFHAFSQIFLNRKRKIPFLKGTFFPVQKMDVDKKQE